MTQSILINLFPNGYSPELHYYLFVVDLDRCAGSCNTLDHLSSRVCVPNETDDLNIHVFNMITGINELRTLPKHLSFKCECKFDSKKSSSNKKYNNNKCQSGCKKYKRTSCPQKYLESYNT